MPYEEMPQVLRSRLAELVGEQLVDLFKLSFAEIVEFGRKGGFYLLVQTFGDLEEEKRVDLERRLEELVGPLGIDAYAVPEEVGG